MAYIPDPADGAAPLDTEQAKTAAAEFRALKSYIQTTVIGSLIAARVAKVGDSTINGILQIAKAGAVDSGLRITRSTDAVAAYTTFNTADGDATFWNIGQFSGSDSFIVRRANGQAGLDINHASLVATFGAAVIANGFRAIQSEGLAILNNGAYISFFNSDGNTRTGYFQMNQGGLAVIAVESGTSLKFQVAARGIIFNNSGELYPDIGGMALGAAAAPWTNAYISNVNAVTVTGRHIGDGRDLVALSHDVVINAIGVSIGTNANGSRFISNTAPSGGGTDGDIWYQI